MAICCCADLAAQTSTRAAKCFTIILGPLTPTSFWPHLPLCGELECLWRRGRSYPKPDPDPSPVQTAPVDAILCPRDIESGRRLPGVKFCSRGSPLRSVLTVPESGRYGPLRSARQGFAFRTDRLDQSFPRLPCVIGKDRLHHARYEEPSDPFSIKDPTDPR